MEVLHVHPELLDQARILRERAESLRAQADCLAAPETSGAGNPVLANSYRRRASELELEAFVAELQSGIPYDPRRVSGK